MELFWPVLGLSSGPLGPCWDDLGGLSGRLGSSGGSRALSGRLGRHWRRLRALLGRLGFSWRPLGPSSGSLGGLLGRLGAVWSLLGRLGASEARKRSKILESPKPCRKQRKSQILAAWGSPRKPLGALGQGRPRQPAQAVELERHRVAPHEANAAHPAPCDILVAAGRPPRHSGRRVRCHVLIVHVPAGHAAYPFSPLQAQSTRQRRYLYAADPPRLCSLCLCLATISPRETRTHIFSKHPPQ